MREHFYVRGSGGYFTNLQLYAYRKARQAWDDLNQEYADNGEYTEQLQEKCVFAVAALGLSVAQLLGQNNPKPQPSGVPSPKALFSEFVTKHGLDPDLVPRFDRLVDFYDAIRHFGRSDDDAKYAKVLALDFDTTRECFETGVEVWKQVISAYGDQLGSDLKDLDPSVHPPHDDEYYLPPGDDA
jgi:hypothetical protein